MKWKPAKKSTSVFPRTTSVLNICSIDANKRTIYAETELFGYRNFGKTDKERKIIDQKALIDCGADENTVDPQLIKRYRLPTWKLTNPLRCNNVDGTPNKMDDITHYTWLHYKLEGKRFKYWFLIAKLGKQQIILGMPWLERINPKINWATKEVQIDSKRKIGKEKHRLRNDIDMRRLSTQEITRNEQYCKG